jgi:hypothetical protein
MRMWSVYHTCSGMALYLWSLPLKSTFPQETVRRTSDKFQCRDIP